MSPPSHTPTFIDIPPNLGTLFRRAFERGSEQNKRPSPKEWHDGLGQLELALAKCTNDSGHSYWRGAGECTWCRLERNGGPEYYFGIGEGGRGFAPDSRKLQEVLRRLAQVDLINDSYNRQDFQPAVSPTGYFIPVQVAQLGRDVSARMTDVRRLEADSEAKDRADHEQASSEFKRFEAELIRQLGPNLKAAENAAQQALLAVAEQRRQREGVEAVLLGLAFFGFVLFLMGFYHWAFRAAGSALAIGCGVFFASYYSRARQSPGELRVAEASRLKRQLQWHFDSQRQAAIQQLNEQVAQRKLNRLHTLNSQRQALQAVTVRLQQEFNLELERLRRTKAAADQQVRGLETRWQSFVASHKYEQQEHSAKVRELVDACGRLAGQYDAESKRVTANAEEAARRRHLRLFAIDGAEIPDIGTRRIQILASHGITTADDIDQRRILEIPRFGPALTANLLAWKSQVLRQFRFSAANAAHSGELRSVVAHFKNQERQLATEIDRRLVILESLAAKCRSSTAALVPELRNALSQLEQARIAEASFLAAFQNQHAA